jgi:hypothetical protein
MIDPTFSQECAWIRQASFPPVTAYMSEADRKMSYPKGDLFGALIRSKLDPTSLNYREIEFNLSFPANESTGYELNFLSLLSGQPTDQFTSKHCYYESETRTAAEQAVSSTMDSVPYPRHITWSSGSVFDSVVREWRNSTLPEGLVITNRSLSETALEYLRGVEGNKGVFEERGITLECLQNVINMFSSSYEHRLQVQRTLETIEIISTSNNLNNSYTAIHAFGRNVQLIFTLLDQELAVITDRFYEEKRGNRMCSLADLIISTSVPRSVILRLSRICSFLTDDIDACRDGWKLFDRIYKELQMVRMTNTDALQSTEQTNDTMSLQSYNICLLSLLRVVSNPLFQILQDSLFHCNGRTCSDEVFVNLPTTIG